MTPAATMVSWSLRRWLWAVAAIFFLQAGLVFLLGHREQRPPERPIFRTAVRLISGPPAAHPGAEDPALLALPSLRGFSGPAWLTFSTLTHQPSEWVESPHWLALDTQALSSAFSDFVRTNNLAPAHLADKPLPPLLGYEPRFPNEPLLARSQLRLEGGLAARSLLAPLELRSWASSEMLSNTVVQAAVGADGFTFSTVLLEGCGLKEADLHALRLAAGARFRPLPRGQRASDGTGPLSWGRMIFQWHTLAGSSTDDLSDQP